MVKRPSCRHSVVRLLLASAAACGAWFVGTAPARAADPVVGPEIASGQPVLVQFNTGFNPVASSGGHNFLVAFEDSGRRLRRGDLARRRHGRDMAPLALQRGRVVSQECNAPSLASNENGKLLVSCYASREGGKTLRVVSRLITTFVPPGRRGG